MTTAHWEKHPHEREWDVCSNCHIGVKRREYGWLKDDPWVSEVSYQYCPWCGAKIEYKETEYTIPKDSETVDFKNGKNQF